MPIQFLQKHVVRPLRKLYRREVLKDPFLLAVKAWKRDRGDSTLRMDYPLGPESLVLDVGGYQGDFAADVVSRYGAKVLVFEPMPGFAASSKERFAGEPRVTVLPYGLGATDGQLMISQQDDASSFFRAHQGAPSGPVVDVRAVAGVWKELQIDRVDLIKINIEGGEYELLPALIDAGLIARIANIQVQFHDFVPGAAAFRDAIRRELAKTHDELWCYEFVWESWRIKPEAAC